MKPAPVIVKTWGAQFDGVRLEAYSPRGRRAEKRLREIEESAEMLAEIVRREERARVGSNVDGLPTPQTSTADAGNPTT